VIDCLLQIAVFFFDSHQKQIPVPGVAHIFKRRIQNILHRGRYFENNPGNQTTGRFLFQIAGKNGYNYSQKDNDKNNSFIIPEKKHFLPIRKITTIPVKTLS